MRICARWEFPCCALSWDNIQMWQADVIVTFGYYPSDYIFHRRIQTHHTSSTFFLNNALRLRVTEPGAVLVLNWEEKKGVPLPFLDGSPPEQRFLSPPQSQRMWFF